MKIFIVCPRLCHGGAERVAVSLANGFVQRGHEVMFFADLYEEQTYVLDDMVQVMNLVPKTNNKLKKWCGAIRILRKQLKMKKDKPDVIIGIMPLCSVVAKLASLGMNIPVVATEHNSFERPKDVKFSIFERFYKFQIVKIFKKITVLTDADKNLLGPKRNNVVVMPNPLVIEPVKQKSVKRNVILAAGRVDNWHVKGFDVLIRAWARVVSSSEFLVSSEGWKLVIAGVWRSPETRTYLDGIAEKCGVLDKIEYVGFVSDMQKLYAESSIFVLSSRYEGFGLVLIEAMSQGCACIACDYKGRQREILNPTLTLPEGEGESPLESQSLGTGNLNLDALPQRTLLEQSGEKTRNLKPGTRNLPVELCETGILCEPDNVEALAEAMKKMIEDDEYRESVRAKAIERSNYYSIENTMDRWEALLKQIV